MYKYIIRGSLRQRLTASTNQGLDCVHIERPVRGVFIARRYANPRWGFNWLDIGRTEDLVAIWRHLVVGPRVSNMHCGTSTR